MSKTAREYVDHYFAGGPYDGELFLSDLEAAGFVIVPKEPTEQQNAAGAEAGAFRDDAQQMSVEEYQESSRDEAASVYRAMIGAASQEPKP